MVADPQGHGVMHPGDPLRQHVLVRYQPGVGPRPGAAHAVEPDFREVVEQEVELADVIGDQDQPLVDRARLDRQQTVHGFFVPRVTAQAPDRLGWVGNYRTGSNFTRSLLHTPVAHH
ncbi:hypothetical protein D9M71_648390 [compost metagenome]